MAFWNPFTWGAPEEIPDYDAAAALVRELPPEVTAGYRTMAEILEAIAGAQDRIRVAVVGMEPAAVLSAKNYVLYGGDLKGWLFGPRPGEDPAAPDRAVNADELTLAGFSAAQGEDLARLADGYRHVALEWDRRAKAGEYPEPSPAAELTG